MTQLFSPRARVRRLGGALAAALALGLLPLSAPASATVVLQDFKKTACPVATQGTPELSDDTTVVPEDGFTDVNGFGTPTNPANIHEFAIDCVAWYKIAAGSGGKQFGPDRNVTRAQMATFIANLIDYVAKRTPTPTGGMPDGLRDPATFPANAFPCDVAPTDVHYASIQRLADKLIVTGSGSNASGNCFNPNGPVKRDQMATFLKNASSVVGEAIPAATVDFFTDDGASSHEDNINAVAGAGIAGGSTATTYNPRGDVRRDQMAAFLARALERMMAFTMVKPPPDADVSVPADVKAGVEFIGTVRSANGTIESVAVSGCGIAPPQVTSAPVAPPPPAPPDPAAPPPEPPPGVNVLEFKATVPIGQPLGPCELRVKTTMKADVTGGLRTATDIRTVNIT